MSEPVTATPPDATAGSGGSAGMPMPLVLAPIENPTLLVLDSTGNACSVAVWREGALAAHRLAEMTRGHGERLLPMVAEVMKAASLAMAALDAIAVTIGPGSFTGLRIGLAAARGLGLALARPVVGITSFLAAAAALPAPLRDGREILVAIDTKRDDVFLQRFDATWRALSPARLTTVSALIAQLPPGPLLLAGDGVALLAPFLPRDRDIATAPGSGAIEAALFAGMAARLVSRGGEAPEGPLWMPDPFYLRAPDVKLTAATAAGRAPS